VYGRSAACPVLCRDTSRQKLGRGPFSKKRERIPGLDSGMLHIPGSKQFRGARDSTPSPPRQRQTWLVHPRPRQLINTHRRAELASDSPIARSSRRERREIKDHPAVRRERTGYPARVAYVWSSFLISSTRRHHTNHQTMNHPCKRNSYIASRLIKHHRRRWQLAASSAAVCG
jgi:hypothetical protein